MPTAGNAEANRAVKRTAELLTSGHQGLSIATLCWTKTTAEQARRYSTHMEGAEPLTPRHRGSSVNLVSEP
jgi:hypothetical protein